MNKPIYYKWNVLEFDDKNNNVARLIYNKYGRKKDRIKLVKKLLESIK